MRPVPRPARPPTLFLRVTGATVAVSGGALVLAPDAAVDTGLSPRTVARYVAEAAPAGATEVRINNVYGSGHGGTWQFVASLTWRDERGTILAGSTELPQNGGQPTLDLNLDAARVAAEHAHGWTEQQVHGALSKVTRLDAQLAMLEFAVVDSVVTIIACHAERDHADAECTRRSPNGGVRERFTDRLLDLGGLDAVSVQRASAPTVEMGLG